MQSTRSRMRFYVHLLALTLPSAVAWGAASHPTASSAHAYQVGDLLSLGAATEWPGLLSLSSPVPLLADLSGDGIQDIVLGQPDYAGDDLGQVAFYRGRSDLNRLTGSEPELTLTPDTASGGWQTYFGQQVAAADLSGDGFPDLVVASRLSGSGLRGRVYVFFGGPDSPFASDAASGGILSAVDADVTLQGSVDSEYLGSALAASPDVITSSGTLGADGAEDLWIASSTPDVVRLLPGWPRKGTLPPGGVLSSKQLTWVEILGDSPDTRDLGRQVVMQPGEGDTWTVVLSDPAAGSYQGQMTFDGRVYALPLSLGALSTIGAEVASGPAGARGQLGETLLLDPDSASTVWLAEPARVGTSASCGWRGALHLLDADPYAIRPCETGSGVLGYVDSMALLPDLGEDGRFELLLGGQQQTLSAAPGVLLLVQSSQALRLETATESLDLDAWVRWEAPSQQPLFGAAVAVGDPNGDGHPDVLVAAPGGSSSPNGSLWLLWSLDGLTDADSDGFLPYQGAAAEARDCDDSRADIHPGADEVCSSDARDEDCDGLVDEDVTVLHFPDLDGDGHGDASAEGVEGCSSAPGVQSHDDCDDGDAATYPGAPQVCDGKVNDCTDTLPAEDVDNDSDGFSECEGDLSDDDAAIFPAAPETCDGKDNNQNGQIDDAPIDPQDFYPDRDADGFGDLSASPVWACPGSPPEGSTTRSLATDCDDSDPCRYKGARRPAWDDAHQCPELIPGRDPLDLDCNGSDWSALPWENLDAPDCGAGCGVITLGMGMPLVFPWLQLRRRKRQIRRS